MGTKVQPVPAHHSTPMGKPSDPAAIRRQQQKIAEDVVRRERIRTEGDIAAPRPPVSPPEKGLVVPQRPRRRRISSQGIAGFKKGSNVV